MAPKEGKRAKRQAERFSLHPLKFEDAVKQALKADPEKVRAKLAGLRKKKKSDSQ